MKRTIVLLTLCLAVASLLAQEKKPDADQQKAMEAYQKAGAVTANHQALKYFVGRWDVESTMWTAPGAPPTVSKNTDTGTLIMGGRFVRMDYRGRRTCTWRGIWSRPYARTAPHLPPSAFWMGPCMWAWPSWSWTGWQVKRMPIKWVRAILRP